MLIRRDELDVGELLEGIQEAGFPGFGAGAAHLIAQQDHLAFAAELLGQEFTTELAALEVVGRDKTDLLVGLEIRVDHDGGNLGLSRARHRGDEGLGIQRSEHDAADFAGGEVLDHLDLLVAVVFAQGTLPEQLHLDALGAEFLLGFDGAGVDGFPELVCGPLGNHRNRVGIGCRQGKAQTSGEGRTEQGFHVGNRTELGPGWASVVGEES